MSKQPILSIVTPTRGSYSDYWLQQLLKVKDVVQLTTKYFDRFPESWILRLKKEVIDFKETETIQRSWDLPPDVNNLEVCRKTPETPYPYQNGNFTGLLEVPIAPFSKKFDIRRLLMPWTTRADNYGYHFENFNNIVWRANLVQQAMPVLSNSTKLWATLT